MCQKSFWFCTVDLIKDIKWNEKKQSRDRYIISTQLTFQLVAELVVLFVGHPQ